MPSQSIPLGAVNSGTVENFPNSFLRLSIRNIYADRADYGVQIINRLAADLKADKTTLHNCVSFAKTYPKFPIVHRGVQFKWRHFRELAKISDDKLRKRLEEETQRNGWTSDELIARIKAEKLQAFKPIEIPSRLPLSKGVWGIFIYMADWQGND